METDRIGLGTSRVSNRLSHNLRHANVIRQVIDDTRVMANALYRVFARSRDYDRGTVETEGC